MQQELDSIRAFIGIDVGNKNDSLNDFWMQLTEVFDDDSKSYQDKSDEVYFFQKLCHIFLRLCVLGLLFSWVIVGFFFTAGLLWPQQVRSRLFALKLNPGSDQTAEAQTRTIADLLKEVDDQKFDIDANAASMQDHVATVGAQLEDLKNDMAEQIEEINDLVNALIHLEVSTG